MTKNQNIIENQKEKKNTIENKTLKDYTNLVSEFPYDKVEVSKNFKKDNDNKKVRRNECNKINNNSRTNKNNLEFFYTSLKKTTKHFINKSGYNGDDIKILLGISYSTLSNLYENEDKRPLDFKLIYDLCVVLNVQFNEFVEKLEGEF